MSKVDWSELKTQKQWKKELQNLLCTNDYAVVHAMERIWDLQTDAEKLSGQALTENGIGFNRVDSVEIKKYIDKHARQSLDGEDIRAVRSIMLKYWKQLMVLSKQKLKAEEEEERLRYEALQVLPGSEDITVDSIDVTIDDVTVDVPARAVAE